jgi:hypothetical protein
MTDKVAILIVSYNMPERTDALVENINKRIKWPHQLFVIDNGSDLVEPSKYTNVFIRDNIQTTGGWLKGLEAAKETGEDWLAYWFVITSAEIPKGDNDLLAPMAQLLVEDPNAVGVHPALTPDSTTSWQHLIARGGDKPRRTWMIDNIASLYRADWFDEIGWFDYHLRYAWGIDLETCYKARAFGRSLWVDERSYIKKVTNIGYTMDRMNMQTSEREMLAGYNMRDVLGRRYGPHWWQIMTEDFIKDEWR